jgi:hypothetical protein
MADMRRNSSSGSSLSGSTAFSATFESTELRLANRCREALSRLFPAPDLGIWSEESTRTMMAILELKRVELHSSKESQWLISNSLIAKVIHTLATIVHFPNPHPDLLLEMKAHLRLLAMALRVYIYNGHSIDPDFHEEVYDGITRLYHIYEVNRRSAEERLSIETWNVEFLLQHCRSLLLSVDNSDIARRVARRAIQYRATPDLVPSVSCR